MVCAINYSICVYICVREYVCMISACMHVMYESGCLWVRVCVCVCFVCVNV